jgi:4-hydroxyphenylpyruvate dioxygenase
MQTGKLGITGLLGLHYYVRDLPRSRRFYVEHMDFQEIGKSAAELERAGRQRSLVFRAGQVSIVCSTPAGSGGRADRYLQKHPDGIGTVMFEVEDARRAFAALEVSGGTPITDVQIEQDDHGTLSTFSITTPFGDTTFRFVERRGYRGLFAGMESYEQPRGGTNAIGFERIDHLTSNFQTMAPALLWLEHVMGFTPLWEVEFHTRDVARYRVDAGSGLRSKVMWDEHSGIKLANNEPYRPSFKASQINVFHEQHRGDGVQHAALSTPDILRAVRELRARGVVFMPTPKSYYQALPGRLAALGIALDEDPAELEQLEILVDGEGPGKYLLQIFLKDSAGLYGSPEAGPFFFEIIERKGDQGFGAGNFRALFESIERDQVGSSGRR